MSHPKVGVVLAAAAGAAFLALAGCASQGGTAAQTPETVPNSCSMPAQNSCKSTAKCKGMVVHKHHRAANKAAESTETDAK